MSKFPANDAKFQAVRDLELPLGEYAITSSGPLGVREIRQIGDIDLVVSDKLWDTLAKKYPVISDGEVTKIRISDDIDVLGEGSFYTAREPGEPSVTDQIEQANLINNLPFVNLRHVLFFKQKMKRPKDEDDIITIKRILKSP